MWISLSGSRLRALLLCLIAPVAAQAEAPASSVWGLGFTAGQERQPYRDFEQKAQALPLLLFENRWLRVAGPTLDLKLSSSPEHSAGLRLRLADEGHEPQDSPFLAGMAERKASLWLGASGAWRSGGFSVTGELLADASNKSQGVRASLGLERPFQTGGRFEITPRLVVHHLDRKYVDYYYGVRTGEALATRPVYSGQSALNVETALRIGYAISPRQRLSLDLGTTRLGSGISRSPLVEGSRQDSARVAFLHLF